MHRLIIVLSGLFGAFGVLGGALGAHLLVGSTLSPASLASYQTAVHYLLLHAVALAALSVWVQMRPESRLLAASALTIALGTGLFAVGLVGWSVWRIGWLQALAPWGGSALILGWILFALSGWLTRPSRHAKI
jgi:uncharacterized membrane protein YgdD (TMEM256/DUF423 family)